MGCILVEADVTTSDPWAAAIATSAVGHLLGRSRPVRVVDDEPSGPTRQLG